MFYSIFGEQPQQGARYLSTAEAERCHDIFVYRSAVGLFFVRQSAWMLST